MEKKIFGNGVESWIETHHEVVSYLARTIDNMESLAYKTRESEGMTGLHTLGIRLTDEFELLHKGTFWDGEYFDLIDKFMLDQEDKKFKVSLKEKVIYSKWCIEDVHECRRREIDNESDLTDKQATEILDNINKYHDANVGINWEVIQKPYRHVYQ